VPRTAGTYALGTVIGRLGRLPDSATVHARTGPCTPCWTWNNHTRPGAAAGAKNGVGPSTRGLPLRSSLIAVVPLPT
jgi:hypothetical protein